MQSTDNLLCLTHNTQTKHIHNIRQSSVEYGQEVKENKTDLLDSKPYLHLLPLFHQNFKKKDFVLRMHS